MINARISSLREKKVSQELEFHKLHSIVKSLTRERNQLKKENAAWKDLHKTGLASEQKHKAMINDLLHENLKLITIMSNSRRPAATCWTTISKYSTSYAAYSQRKLRRKKVQLRVRLGF
jgi:protein subunit release factor B